MKNKLTSGCFTSKEELLNAQKNQVWDSAHKFSLEIQSNERGDIVEIFVKYIPDGLHQKRVNLALKIGELTGSLVHVDTNNKN